MSAATADEPLRPRAPGGLVRGASLALLAHAALLAALTVSVQWRTRSPEAVSAELWSAVPQTAAPPAPAPTPAPPPPPAPAPAPPPPPPPARVETPPDPQIAIAQAEREKQRQAERERAEKARADEQRRERLERERAAEAAKLRQQREDEAREKQAREQRVREEREKERARQQAEERRLAEQRQRNLERLMSQAGNNPSATSTGTAAQSSGPSASYAGRLVAAVRPNIVFTGNPAGNPAADVEVRTGPSGSILSRRLLKSSGNKEWDEAVLRAIDRTATLPRDVDGRIPSTIVMTFTPQE